MTNFEELIKNASKITLPGGVVGKVSFVLIVVAIAIATIASTLNVIWVSAIAIVFIFVLAMVVLNRLISFANRNPQAALLEGAEFLLHEQLRMGTKNHPDLIINSDDITESPSVKLSKEEKRVAQLPDQSPADNQKDTTQS